MYFLYTILWPSQDWEVGLVKADSHEQAKEKVAQRAGQERHYWVETLEGLCFIGDFFMID